jgi:hypothetical protein
MANLGGEISEGGHSEIDGTPFTDKCRYAARHGDLVPFSPRVRPVIPWIPCGLRGRAAANLNLVCAVRSRGRQWRVAIDVQWCSALQASITACERSRKLATMDASNPSLPKTVDIYGANNSFNVDVPLTTAADKDLAVSVVDISGSCKGSLSLKKGMLLS